ncbi:MAG: FAD-binding protein [Pseudomonadota bacterium]
MSDDQTMFSRQRVGDVWRNWHETQSGQIARVDVISRPPDDLSYNTSSINRCTAQIQRAIREAKQDGLECRAVGRGWSLSAAPITSGVMIDIAQLNMMKRIHHSQVEASYPGDKTRRRGLVMVQGGAYVSELNRWLEASGRKLSLRTSGAANGQTIAGATQSGTHGSVLEFGAMHDAVVSIHLLAGDTKQYWIERASYPVIKESAPNAYGAELIRDDDLFNAVVMGLGAFGVIHNMVLEARPRFTLEAHNFRDDRNGQPIVLDQAMRKRIADLDFTSDPHLDPDGASGTPYFFQTILNPNTNPPQVLLTHMYEKEWDASHPIDYTMPENSFGPGYDTLSVVGRVLNALDFLVPLFANLISGQIFQTGQRKGTWGELFGYKSFRTKVVSGTVAVPLKHALAALDALIELNTDEGPVPLVYGCRYVRKSDALLAFNKWDTTCVVGIDGIYNDDSLRFYDLIPAKMEQVGIPFTQHWGKENAYTPERVREAYGNAAVDTWISARERLLPDPADRATFSNAYLRNVGLT